MVLEYRSKIENIMCIRCPREKGKRGPTPWKLLDYQETKYSVDFAYRVPNGYSFLDLEKQVDSISAAIGYRVEIINRGGAVVVSIPTQDFPGKIDFKKDMLQDLKERQVLLGYTRTMQKVVHDFRVPHLLIAGMAGYGKTDLIRLLIYQLISRFTPEQLEIKIIDLKGFSFLPFRQVLHITQIARSREDALTVLRWGYETMQERSEQVWKEGVRGTNFKWSIVLIDEASQIAPGLIRDKVQKEIANQCDQFASAISCIGREASVGLIYCTQRPDSHTINPSVKANMDASICFRTKTKSNSEIVIDGPGAEELPQGKPGRCIYSATNDVVLQVPYVGNDAAWEKLLAPFKKGVTHDKETGEDHYDNVIAESYPNYRLPYGRTVYDWSGFPQQASVRNTHSSGKVKID